MRQAHYVESGGAPANLIFYAPLTENDLTDHISGAGMLFTSTTHTWNATHGMYEFKKSGTGKAYWSGLDLGLPFTSSDYSNVECSCFFDYVMTNSNDKKYVNLVGLAIGQDGSTSKRFPLFFLKFIGATITVNIKYRMGWTLSNGVFKFYVDGQEVNLNSPYAPVDTFDYTACNAYVSLAAGNWSGNDGGGCFGNIRIYDRALTASEVALL